MRGSSTRSPITGGSRTGTRFRCATATLRVEMKSPAEVRDKLAKLPTHLRDRIRGQDQVIPRIVSVLQRGELGLAKPHRPRGSFLFLGPTGVGKTEITLAFTSLLMGQDRLFRFDMSEYQTQESLALLLGGSSDEEGTLGAITQKSDSGTLLFDEIEKAHPRLLDIFLQVLDAARITTASGRVLDLTSFYVVFTSNIGSAEIVSLQHSSFTTMERHVLTRAQQAMRPELYARITDKLVFNRLSYDVQLEIAAMLLAKELEFLCARKIHVTAAGDVLPFIVRRGFHPRLGARPMRDAVEKLIGDAVVERLMHSGEASGELRVADESRLTIAD
jgi:ATP-dependent Clp protease ATP-binding subunit ClpA